MPEIDTEADGKYEDLELRLRMAADAVVDTYLRELLVDAADALAWLTAHLPKEAT